MEQQLATHRTGVTFRWLLFHLVSDSTVLPLGMLTFKNFAIQSYDRSEQTACNGEKRLLGISPTSLMLSSASIIPTSIKNL